MKGRRMSCSEYWSIVGVGAQEKGPSQRGGERWKEGRANSLYIPPLKKKAKAGSFDENDVVNSKYCQEEIKTGLVGLQHNQRWDQVAYLASAFRAEMEVIVPASRSH